MMTNEQLLDLIKTQEMLMARLVMHVPVGQETAKLLSETLECLDYTQKVLHAEKHDKT